ncbi:non-ribosomal peptide synthetase [Catellatospora methionotrophica]|uniref:non-ribosomal peptide synthetase n=1 Tax=Catellatospora methionotrophica TaxID=121620 RepID=UPI0033E05EEF
MRAESLTSQQAAALVPLTDAQHGVWFAEQLGDNHGAYHLGLVVDLHGDLDVAALDGAVAAVVARHPVLAAVPHSAGPVALRLGAHSPRLELTGSEDPGVVLSRPFRLDGSMPLTRFVLQRVAARHHRLVVAAHHLVFDGQSKDILLRELAAAYGGDAVAATADYAAAVEVGSAAVDRLTTAAGGYWAGRPVTPGRLALPGVVLDAAARRPAAWPGGTVDVALAATAAEGLAGAARAAGCTRFEFLLAALHLLLHRYGGESVTVAVDVGTRGDAARDVVGMFVNELPITTSGPVRGSFAAFVAALRAQLRAVYPLRAVPVTRVAAVRAGTALSPVSVSYRGQGPAPTFAGLRATVDWAPFTGTARGPLHLQIVDTDGDLVLRLRHDGALVTAGTAQHVARHLAHLLQQLVRDPDVDVRRLELVTPDEAATRAVTLTAAPGGPESTLTALLHEAAAATGGTVVCGEHRLTARQVHEAAQHLARQLAGRGIGPGAVVGVCMPRGTTALIGLLGIVYSGAAYLPLDPRFPAQRLRFVLDDAAPALVLCSPDSVAALPADTAPTLVIADPWHITVDGGSEPTRPGPADPAYIMYTSGSTGRPKGVVVPHRAIAHLLRAMAAALGSGPGDVWLALTSLSFDISTVECFLPLLTGASMVVADDTQARDGAALLRAIGEHDVTHVQATPSTWDLILSAVPAPGQLSRVTALSGGEPLVPALAARLLPLVPRLVNVYGPTETTVWSTFTEVTAADRVSIGGPLAGTRAYVVDGNLRAVPDGITGQLCLAGVGVADHYHARPSLTAQRFLPDPAGPPGSRLYVTGDNAQVLPDGTLVCLGRDDLQVKIRGHRVELGEIEASLREYGAVTGAVVAVADDVPGGRLIAYVTGTALFDEPGLRAQLAEQLPAHMLPAVYVQLAALPLTTSGKVDRAALAPAPPRPTAPDDERGRVAGDGIDETMAAIWREALQVDRIGPDDDLFDAGGHSLTVTQIVVRIRDRFGVDLPLHVLWDAPTVRAAAAAVRETVAR